MRFSKKAQGMSMNVIIIAALALIVLVVLGVIFMGKIGDFRKKSDMCQNNGGICVDKGTCTGEFQREQNFVCFGADGKTPDQNKVCCISIS